MQVSSFCASHPRNATHTMSATELVLHSSVATATPSHQRLRPPCLRRSSTTIYNLALNWSSHRRVPRRGAAGSTSRRDAAARRGGTRASRSITSVAAASAAPSQQHQQATAVSRDDERSTGALLSKMTMTTHYQAILHMQELGVTHPLRITGPGGWPRTVGHDH